MDNKFSNIKERILYIVKNQGFKLEFFFDKIGVTYGNFKGDNKKRPISSDTIANILSEIPDLNIEWLITGRGEMLKSHIKAQESQNNDEFISLLKENNDLLKKQLKDKEDKEVLYKEKIAYKTKEIERLKTEIERLKGKDIYKMEGKIESQRLQIEVLRGKVPL